LIGEVGSRARDGLDLLIGCVIKGTYDVVRVLKSFTPTVAVLPIINRI
jgi:hypothetical protein